MTSSSGIPRPFSITDAKRAREEEARKREQATSARNTSSTTIGSGGRLDVVGGDLTVSEGGNASVKDGGAFRVEGGGSMEIVDDGVVKVVGSTVDDLTNTVMVAEAALSTEEVYHTSSGVTTRSPGLFFKTERAEGGKVHSAWGDDVSVNSGKRLVDYGPLVEPGVYKSTSVQVNPGSAGLYASAAFGLNPDFTDSRSQCYMETYPDALVFELRTVALGLVGGINVSMIDPKLRLYGRDGVDVKGPFTVDGQPVGGAPEWGDVKNKPTTFPPSAHTHATAQVTGLDTALAGKAATNHTHPAATTTTAGFMSVTDKVILNSAPTKAYVDDSAASMKTQISYYTATGVKGSFDTANQAISTPTYEAAPSTMKLATERPGGVTVTEAGIYTVTMKVNNQRAVSGRSFIDINDSSGVSLARAPIASGEDAATVVHGGLLLAAGDAITFGILQTSTGNGGVTTATYSARIWVIKHP